MDSSLKLAVGAGLRACPVLWTGWIAWTKWTEWTEWTRRGQILNFPQLCRGVGVVIIGFRRVGTGYRRRRTFFLNLNLSQIQIKK